MSPRFSLRIEGTPAGHTVYVQGSVTELADFSPLRDLSGAVTVDAGGVERFNSVGVQKWVAAIQALSARTTRLDFINATDVLLSQSTVIRGFLGRGIVRTILARHECPNCGHSLSVRFERSADFPDGEIKNRTAPRCEKCGEQMMLDDALYLTAL
nr:hypothetical protein [uncultured bacterium]